MSAAQEEVLKLLQSLRLESKISRQLLQLSCEDSLEDEIPLVTRFQVIGDETGSLVLKIESERDPYLCRMKKCQITRLAAELIFRVEEESSRQDRKEE